MALSTSLLFPSSQPQNFISLLAGNSPDESRINLFAIPFFFFFFGKHYCFHYMQDVFSFILPSKRMTFGHPPLSKRHSATAGPGLTQLLNSRDYQAGQY